MKRLVLVCLCFGMIGSAWADISEEKAIDCYRSSGSKESFVSCLTGKEVSGIKSKWSSDAETDPLTDKTVYTAILVASKGTGRFNRPVALIVRCKDSKTEMYIAWNDYLGSEAYVTFRVGDSKAQTKEWSVSTDSKATFYPASPVGLLKDIVGAEKVVAQVTPYNESPVTAIFNTLGADEALKGIREGCKW